MSDHRYIATVDVKNKRNHFKCESCDREFYIYWGNVAPKRKVISYGDQTVSHSGQTVGLGMGINLELEQHLEQTKIDDELWKGLFPNAQDS